MRSANVPIRSVPGTRVHRVARREGVDLRSDADDGSGDIVAQRQRKPVREDLPELTDADLLIQLIHPGGNGAHQNVTVADGGFGHLRFVKRALVLSMMNARMRVSSVVVPLLN